MEATGGLSVMVLAAGGTVGAALVQRLLSLPPQAVARVVALDAGTLRRPCADGGAADPRLMCVRGGARSGELLSHLLAAHRVDVVIHPIQPPPPGTDPLDATLDLTYGTHVLVHACGGHGAVHACGGHGAVHACGGHGAEHAGVRRIIAVVVHDSTSAPPARAAVAGAELLCRAHRDVDVLPFHGLSSIDEVWAGVADRMLRAVLLAQQPGHGSLPTHPHAQAKAAPPPPLTNLV